MIPILLAVAISFALLAATVVIHYEVLNTTSRMMPQLHRRYHRRQMLLVLAGIFVAHLLEISLYAGAYHLMTDHFGLGGIAGEVGLGTAALDYFYFSLTTYTTLGIGDVYPTGPLRIVAGTESLNGLVLIGWSASYTFLAMKRLWGEAQSDPDNGGDSQASGDDR
ncbi:MAG TPA: potassium channel family protein [Sphingomicrobium sp.]|jgi:hypothetical protein|nr:potassium channel family protein [Sphingomicrobium sp.]